MTIRLNGSTSGYTEIDAPAVAGSNTLVLPTGNGTSGQYLQTNGSGALSWAGAGKILQVVQTVKSNIFSTTSSSFVDVPGLDASITPFSSSNKILCVVNIGVGSNNAGADNLVRVVRGSTQIVPNDTLVRTESTSICLNWNISFLDSPATTSSTTYKVQILSESTNTVKVNSRNSETAIDGISTITLMEVAA